MVIQYIQICSNCIVWVTFYDVIIVLLLNFNAGGIIYPLSTVHLIIAASKQLVCFLKNIEIDL
jgi:hypothetical protein